MAWQSVFLELIDELREGYLIVTFLWPQSLECGLLSLKIAVCWEAQVQCPGMGGRCQHWEEGQISFLGGLSFTLLDWWVDVFSFCNLFCFLCFLRLFSEREWWCFVLFLIVVSLLYIFNQFLWHICSWALNIIHKTHLSKSSFSSHNCNLFVIHSEIW